MSGVSSEGRSRLGGFHSDVVDRLRAAGGTWELPGGQVLLPRVFGFCRGVERALARLEQAAASHVSDEGRLLLLGQIIHNPWVNEYFRRRGVEVLTAEQVAQLERFVAPADCGVIPAFGVPLPIEQRLRAIGCRVVDTTCGDVRRVWLWAMRAVEKGYGVFIFGRPRHDETVVIKSRLAAGGRYVVVSGMKEARRFCEIIAGDVPTESFREAFADDATNAASPEAFSRLAQVSQTTMLYDETMKVREQIRTAYARRYGSAGAARRLLFEPTVCRATQDRQSAAVELCQKGCDLVIVVGGFGSSNTNHLFELAGRYARAFFIEAVDAIRSDQELETFDPLRGQSVVARGWLPGRRPLRIGVLAGASSPEVVVGRVVERLAEFLS